VNNATTGDAASCGPRIKWYVNLLDISSSHFSPLFPSSPSFLLSPSPPSPSLLSLPCSPFLPYSLLPSLPLFLSHPSYYLGKSPAGAKPARAANAEPHAALPSTTATAAKKHSGQTSCAAAVFRGGRFASVGAMLATRN
jgi:hypothetical protein